MKILQGHGVATVIRNARIERTISGCPYVSVLVEFDPRVSANGGEYCQRVEVRSFEKETEDMMPYLVKGTIVYIGGDVDAVAQEVNGRTFYNPRLTGRIEIVEEE